MSTVPFVARHVGPRPDETAAMLSALGFDSLDTFVDAAVPATIRTTRSLDLPEARSEEEVLAALRALAEQNRVLRPMIGQGYFGTFTPPVIRRNVLENPAWYTSYTPYQAEISQGRLEALLTFQTMVEDLTALPVANASLLDEATAVAEAVALLWRASKAKTGVVVLDCDLYPQSLAVARARAEAIGLPVVVADLSDDPAATLAAVAGTTPEAAPVVGVVVQQVGASGRVHDLAPVVAAAREVGALVAVATDLLALTLLTPPGETGADVAVGSAQRFGVPLFGGGPHASFMAVRSGLERSLPGRLVGVSVDADGNPAYRLALQTREQHIRREKATSNICTAQALLAVVAAMYAVYHGPEGLRTIAERTHAHAHTLAATLRAHGVEVEHATFFDTIRTHVPDSAHAIRSQAAARGIELYAPDPDHVQIACDETTTESDLTAVLQSFTAALGLDPAPALRAEPGPDPVATTRPADQAQPGADETQPGADEVTHAAGEATLGAEEGPAGARRVKAPAGTAGDSASPADPSSADPTTRQYLQHPVFHQHRSETAMLRYLRTLADKDLALDRTMIPLGSCTMKLNATAQLEPITWPGFADIHPYAPAENTRGYQALVEQLQQWLAQITGYAAVSVQPNAGSQGELAGLLAIRDYHRSRGDDERDVCLIPASAHGTNAASAALAGLRVVVVATAADGSIDLADLDAKLQAHGPRVAAIMITYPSTHGVYEEGVRLVARRVHDEGGQVYIDGANLNALVGLARPAELGGDVSHLNLHKTFAIPHGGGGPGVGPVAVATHLTPFLPADPFLPAPTSRTTPVAAPGGGFDGPGDSRLPADPASTCPTTLVAAPTGGLDGPGDSRLPADPASTCPTTLVAAPKGGLDEGGGAAGGFDEGWGAAGGFDEGWGAAGEVGSPSGVPVSAARWGSAGVLPISWAYVALLGPDGLRQATVHAVLAANYLATRLREHYPVLYAGPGGLVAHECILDLRAITQATGVTAEDVAKRLMDYGFHAPTLAFPVPGTLMVEPTESEDLAELDRFVAAMVAIRAEIDEVAAGTWPLADSPLRQAPHTAAALTADEWTHPYPRSLAAYPVPSLRAGKYWPPVRRVDGARGDRTLICSCPPVEAYA